MRKDIKTLHKINKPKKLSVEQKKQIKKYYKERGYKNVRTDWHQFYIANNHFFSEKYIPADIFHSIISVALNEMRQWPTLLDKNLLETIFNGYKQPYSVVKNINGFYYINKEQVSKADAINECFNFGISKELVIKPSIESGNGRKIVKFSIDNKRTTYKKLPLEKLFDTYKQDFIVQEVVKQHQGLKILNSTSLNTIRIMTYLKEKEVHVLNAMLRIGRSGKFTDNCSAGGIVCGIKDDGRLKEFAYSYYGDRMDCTDSNVNLKDRVIPAYSKLTKMAKEMHFNIPYFRIVSWDIGIDDENDPVLIEYNTYHQGINPTQLANGPLFGQFTDELLEIGRHHKS